MIRRMTYVGALELFIPLGVIAFGVIALGATSAFADGHPDVVVRMREMVAATPAEGYASCCEAIERMDLEPDLPSITAPTLVIAGAADPSTPPEHGYRIADRIPGGRITVVPDAAHLVNVEQPNRVNDLIVDHLRDRPI